nr:HD domain-containing protein [Anaerostipes hadrus]
MSVARISYLMILEKRLSVSKDIIYATALLHDLGRADQYEKGISHEEAGAILAEEILTDCGYTREERKFMTDTILRHRDMKEESESFASIFYRADKLSRDCIHCKARQECYWPEEKKNNKYIY